MIYYVKSGDTLDSIARKFNVTVKDILNANVICNPNLIFTGQILVIPKKGVELPTSGGNPYYIVKPQDSLYCMAVEFNTTVENLVNGNQIKNPNEINQGSELLVAYKQPNGEQLYNMWDKIGNRDCNTMSSLETHGVYYIGTFMWQSLGEKAIPYLTELLNHKCNDVRYYTLLSIGRMPIYKMVWNLSQMLNDSDKRVANMAALVLKRMRLVNDISKRIHVTIGNNKLLSNLGNNPLTTELPEGTAVRVLTWGIPSPSGEEGPVGGIQIYDYVQVLSTGETGFLPRVGHSEIVMI